MNNDSSQRSSRESQQDYGREQQSQRGQQDFGLQGQQNQQRRQQHRHQQGQQNFGRQNQQPSSSTIGKDSRRIRAVQPTSAAVGPAGRTAAGLRLEQSEPINHDSAINYHRFRPGEESRKFNRDRVHHSCVGTSHTPVARSIPFGGQCNRSKRSELPNEDVTSVLWTNSVALKPFFRRNERPNRHSIQ